MYLLIINAVLFQVVWFVAVQADNLLAFLALAIYWLIHIASFFKTRAQVAFCIITGVIGWSLDSILANLGVIKFAGLHSVELYGTTLHIAPVWLLCIWLCFTPTLLFSLRWLSHRPILASLLGFFSVPLSYLGGVYFSSSVLGYSELMTFCVTGLIWAILLPVLASAAARYEPGEQGASGPQDLNGIFTRY